MHWLTKMCSDTVRRHQHQATYKFGLFLHDIALHSAPVGVAAGKALPRYAHATVAPASTEALTSVEAAENDRDSKGGRRSERTVPASERKGDGRFAARVQEGVGSVDGSAQANSIRECRSIHRPIWALTRPCDHRSFRWRSCTSRKHCDPQSSVPFHRGRFG